MAEDSGNSKSLWFVGILLTSLSSFFGTTGKVLLRFSHLPHKPILIRRVALGVAIICLTILNPALDIMAYSFAAQSIIVPFAAMSIVWNTLFAPFALKESLTKLDLLGTLMIISGVTLVAVSGDHDSHSYTYSDILGKFGRPIFIGYGIGITVVFFIGIYLIRKFKEGHVVQFIMGASGGLVGGNLFFVKCTTELLRIGTNGSTAERTLVWSSTITYVIFGSAGLVCGTGLYLLNRALRYYPAIQIIPLYESFLILTGSISAAVFFGDSHLSTWQQIVFPLGLLLTLAGIPVLTKKEMPGAYYELEEEKKPEQEREAGVELADFSNRGRNFSNADQNIT